MIHDVKAYFGLKKEFRNAGFFETENYNMVFQDVISAIKEGHIIAITGIVGSGKTVTARKIRQSLQKRKEVLVSTNFSVDKNRVNLGILIYALFADLMTDANEKIPSRQEFRERQLMKLIRKRNRPVALFIDEAHDLHHKTLVGLKRLQEIVREADSVLSIVLIGHPKLSIDLSRPAMEEIGGRTTIIQMNGILGSEKEYIHWLLHQCSDEGVKPSDIFTDEAIDFMAEKFSTPLQINHYAWISLVKAHQIGQKPAHIDILETIVSNDLDNIEARLKRSEYDLKTISETVNAKPSEIKALFTGRLVSDRAKEIQDEILKLGITAG